MPKKTRKEKLLSAERKKMRLLQLLEQPAPSQRDSANQRITPSVKAEAKKKESEIQLSTEDLEEKKYFVRDFRKSLLLIAAIIALEIIIYFGTINNYFSFGS